MEYTGLSLHREGAPSSGRPQNDASPSHVIATAAMGHAPFHRRALSTRIVRPPLGIPSVHIDAQRFTSPSPQLSNAPTWSSISHREGVVHLVPLFQPFSPSYFTSNLLLLRWQPLADPSTFTVLPSPPARLYCIPLTPLCFCLLVPTRQPPLHTNTNAMSGHNGGMPGGHNPDGMPHSDPTPAPGGDTGVDSNQAAGPPGMHGASGAGHQMSPFLFTRKTDFFVLFEGAFIESDGAFAGALLLSCLFALLATFLSQAARVYETRALRKGKLSSRVVGSLIHGFRQFMHYVAMLIVMTMNVWLIIAVIVGHVLGWFLYAVILSNRLQFRQNSPDKTADPADAACDC